MFSSEAHALSAILADFQAGVGYDTRERAADIMAVVLSRLATGLNLKSPSTTPRAKERILSLRTSGLVELGECLTRERAADVRNYFEQRLCFNSHVPAQSDGRLRTISETRTSSQHASYGMHDVLSAPHLIELANSDEMLAIAEGYLGCPPTLYSVNAFWSFPQPQSPTHGLQTFHRDFDDFRFCTLFIFLTDVEVNDGAHAILVETHRYDVFCALLQRIFKASTDPLQRQLISSLDVEALFAATNLNLDAVCEEALSSAARLIYGSAGSGMIEDTYSLHRGSIPQTPRLLFWARYGLYRNVATFKDHATPTASPTITGRIPQTPYHHYVNRLLISGFS